MDFKFLFVFFSVVLGVFNVSAAASSSDVSTAAAVRTTLPTDEEVSKSIHHDSENFKNNIAHLEILYKAFITESKETTNILISTEKGELEIMRIEKAVGLEILLTQLQELTEYLLAHFIEYKNHTDERWFNAFITHFFDDNKSLTPSPLVERLDALARGVSEHKPSEALQRLLEVLNK